MSGSDGKKLSLKERMALKGKTVQGYTPADDFVPQGVAFGQPAHAAPQNGGSAPFGSQGGYQPPVAPQPVAKPVPDLGLGAITPNTPLNDELYDRITRQYQINPNYYFLLNEQYPHLYAQYYQRFQMEQYQQAQKAYAQQYQGFNGQQQQTVEEEDEEMEEEVPQNKPGQKQVGTLGQQKPAGGDKKPQQAAQSQPQQQKPAAPKQETPAANKPAQGGNNNAGAQKGGQNKPGDKKDGGAGKDPKSKNAAPLPVPVKKYVEEIIDVQKLSEKEHKTETMVDLNKEPMNIIFIGHVDSGKSTMCGSILLFSGKVDKEEFRRYEIEAKQNNRLNWLHAYIMDINPEERDKGITVEVGKAMFELKKKRFTIIDCPGHKNYVPNMIAGASQADIAALVVSSKSGEFEAGFDKGGQTREHAILASYLGSSHLIVIINKMDDNNWSEKRFKEIKDKMTPFLKEVCEYDVDKSITWVPVSAINNLNMETKVPEAICPWYKGEGLLDTLDNIPKKERVYRDCLRFPVSDKHQDKGDLIVYGKIESGAIKDGQKLLLMPGRKEITVLKIQDNEDKTIPFATTGDNIKIFIKGVASEEIKRGNVITGLQFVCHTAIEFEADLTVIDPPANKVISGGFPCVLHLHATQEEVEIIQIKMNKSTKKAGGHLKQGESGIVHIKVTLCLTSRSSTNRIFSAWRSSQSSLSWHVSL